jgi:hypothetical protein
VNGSLQRVTGGSGCVAPTPTQTPTQASVTPTPSPTQTSCNITIYFNVSASPSPGGWDTSTDACQGTGTPLTVYFSQGISGCSTNFQDIFNDGKVFYTNSNLTTVFDGNNKYFKSVSSANSGIAIQIGTDGVIDTLSSPC